MFLKVSSNVGFPTTSQQLISQICSMHIHKLTVPHQTITLVLLV